MSEARIKLTRVPVVLGNNTVICLAKVGRRRNAGRRGSSGKGRG